MATKSDEKPGPQAPKETAAATGARTRASFTKAMDEVSRRTQLMNEAASKRTGELTGRSRLATFGGAPEPITGTDDDAAQPSAGLLQKAMESATGRDIRVLKLSQIHENPFQPREVYTAETKRNRALSIKADGQYDLIHVIPHPTIPGEFMIGDGWTRVSGCIEYEVCEELTGEVHHNKTPLEAAWMGYEQNEQREQFCDLDKAFFFDKLYAQGQTQEQVETRTGISQAKLSNYAAFKKLEPQLLDLVRQNGKRFGAFLIPHLVKVSTKVSPEKALLLAMSFSSGEQSTRWFVEQCGALIEKHKKKPSAPGKSGRIIRYNNGTLKEKNGKFDLSIQVAVERRDAFNAELERLLLQFGETVADADIDASTSKEEK